MAPKKKQQQKGKSAAATSSKGKTTASSSGPKLQLSAENENRLRRLLLNSGRSTPSPATAEQSLSKEQKAKRLHSVYERLSCDGFRDDQIELSLSALKERATYEVALDWLCLNIPGNELPLKFSSGSYLHTSEGTFWAGSVGVISTAREDWVFSGDSSEGAVMQMDDKVPLIIKKERKDNETLESVQHSQADWIRQYMERQDEDETDSWETDSMDYGSSKKVVEPRSDYESIIKDYHAARLQAANAKDRGDKKGQEEAGQIIRKLKQEISALGLPADILESGYVNANRGSKDKLSIARPSENSDGDSVGGDTEHETTHTEYKDEVDLKKANTSGSHESLVDSSPTVTPTPNGEALETESGDVELGGFFLEEGGSDEIPAEILELQKKEKMKELCSEKNLEKMEGIWKKGEPKKIPKAVFHQLCQRSGWEAPKYDKVVGNGHNSGYSINVLRKASGRGKSRKAGGLTTIQLPSQDESFSTVEDAQNRVAAYALHCLFPDLPVHLALSEPYATLVLKWKEGALLTNVSDRSTDRRAGFVDSLLNAKKVEHKVGSNSVDEVNEDLIPMASMVEDIASEIDHSAESIQGNMHAENIFLKKEQELKNNTNKYKEMLRCRSSLPIAELKDEILHLLEENNVVVISGETGCGKTTQVPQYILDNMIQAGCGGNCNIICTQPRRIAAVSVAERVADECCESSPGSTGSLVGYQVRLDSARNERTKLLFCTTGILLRMISGNKDLAGVSHVIVDEVHERSLLGDFLLIVLKNLIEKQSTCGKPKLKVILMSATVDSHMFSRYFGNCPVVTAQGRTHPVTTLFLEDIHEKLNYRLASDSPASIHNGMYGIEKSGLVGNKRGKKNLVISGWGDESLLSEEVVNPYYDKSDYTNYSEQTRQNLRRLNEDCIDYDLLEDLVGHIDETFAEGAILVFLPGVAEINLLVDKLAASRRFGGSSSEWLLPLHSSIAPEDQKKVFQKPPNNIRKVIVATNIAETSITIDDIVYVVDCGKHKENRYNPHKKLSSMVEDWISQANARQRRGRAGRVKPGLCFSLYTHHRYEKLMRPYQIPEMMRMPLVELCLQVKLLSLGGIEQFLSEALEPPKEEAIASAVSSLYEVGAIEGNEELTPLGYHLAKLPVDVLIGKMMLYGAIFGCLSPILTISAFLSYKSPFVYPKDERESVERAKLALLGEQTAIVAPDGGRQSDHLLMLIAYQKWDKILSVNGVKAAQKFCSSHFLSSSVMYMIRDMRIQFATLLADIGLIEIPKNYQIGWKKKEKLDSWLSDISQPFNQYSTHSVVVKAILCAGLYPNVATTEESNAGRRLVWFDGKREVHIHPSSINSSQKTLQYPFIVFLEKVETNKVFLRDTTVVSPYSILLFGGSITVHHQTGLIIVDNWIKMAAPAQTAVLFKELRITLHSILKELISKPQSAAGNNEVIKSIIHLFLEEDKPTK
ncbi:DExH-box ATP-dependent RNA helicase DExH7, chloroplastic isoform X2 [Andrographis paniculata]|uniref:DExH-box ATP-dependent RNA helicase DExH7, chloroplastic isoform X2 n=1 Tax=Andrographis paniculata TaxID=175694 RepID=UPI0021E7D77A|nr:DExH-box ATP-dependent RNA helicase DExH7, chloroplastic isoform X2 [Andrographis paniculata]